MNPRTVSALLLAALGVVVLALWGDPFSLQLVAYLPILIAGWLTGSDKAPAAGEVLGSWVLWRSVLILVAAGVLFWLARRTWPREHLLGHLDRPRLRRVLYSSVAIAAACPLFYAVTRIAWVLGIPLGLDAEFLESIQSIVNNGLVLGLLAVGGAVLTIGLLRPWGEVFPRWMPFVGGKPVPVRFVTRFACGVAFLVAAASAYFIRAMVTGSEISMAPAGAERYWGAWLPEMVWPVWALALAVAAVAYAERRRRAATEAYAPAR
ncbi:hypothetical protein [Blastococcus sp. Marseille-P5729]|uniref:hypothetical protein n=1 Tax=Blastococcus sp. Marseille-P5729 TaxID=2086582 RepID=UPI000D0F7BE2|nr:hypothetical protein [Blastococcus sp. Marseille-P5729]